MGSKNRVTKTALYTSIIAASVSAVSTAIAQNGEGAVLEEVLVTAQRRSESLQDVPIAVSALSADDLYQSGVEGTKSLQIVVPSLVINNAGSNANIYLRGVGTRLSYLSLAPSTATYIDDQYINRPTAQMFSLSDIERVEVLKGPQGTLYGRNATAGAIRLITADPADEFDGKLRVTVGNYNYRTLNGSVSVPITDDLGMRITGLKADRDGYADNLHPDGLREIDDQDEMAARIKTVWNFSDAGTAKLRIDHLKRDDMAFSDQIDLSPTLGSGEDFVNASLGETLGASTEGRRGKVFTAIDQSATLEMTNVELRIDYSFDMFDFAWISSFSDVESRSRVDADATGARAIDADAQEESKAYAQEFQIASNAQGKLEWMAGLYFFEQDGTTHITADASEWIRREINNGAQDADISTWAVYGNASYEFSDKWTLGVGGRWSVEDKKVSNPLFQTVGEDDWSEFTPRATLQYSTDTGMAYFTYSRGFKSGGFNYPFRAGNDSLDPEILDMLELGYKTEVLQNRLRLNASLFYYDYEDLQLTRAAAGSGGTIVTVTENVGAAEIYGLDADFTWLATDRLSFLASFTLMSSEYTDFSDATAKVFRLEQGLPGTRDVAYNANGESLLRAPDFAMFATAKYDFEIPSGNIPVALTYSYKDEYYFDFVSEESSPRATGLIQDAISIVNARISYEPSAYNWVLSAWVNNLTDEEYYDDLVANAAGLHGSPAEPRTYGIDFTYQW